MERQDGFILTGIGGFYYVKTADAVLACRAKGIFRKEGIVPLAGDRVCVEGSVQDEDLVVAEIYERKNSFQRPPIANVDHVFLVVSTIEPRPNIFVLDKMTAICCNNGVAPVIILTKSDLEEAEDFKRIYAAAGFPVMDFRADKAKSLREIESIAENGLSVFIGNSGVGKSTLLNELCPELSLETSETSKKLGRGKHTTRAVTLYEYRNGYIADTPGFSMVEFERGFSIESENLIRCFPDLSRYGEECFFADCTHRVEKGCGVVSALRRGDVEASRHESYCSLYEEARGHKHWEKR